MQSATKGNETGINFVGEILDVSLVPKNPKILLNFRASVQHFRGKKNRSEDCVSKVEYIFDRGKCHRQFTQKVFLEYHVVFHANIICKFLAVFSTEKNCVALLDCFLCVVFCFLRFIISHGLGLSSEPLFWSGSTFVHDLNCPIFFSATPPHPWEH